MLHEFQVRRHTYLFVLCVALNHINQCCGYQPASSAAFIEVVLKTGVCGHFYILYVIYCRLQIKKNAYSPMLLSILI